MKEGKNRRKKMDKNTCRQTEKHSQADRWVGRNHNQSMDYNGEALQPHVGGPNDVLVIVGTSDALQESSWLTYIGFLLH